MYFQIKNLKMSFQKCVKDIRDYYDIIENIGDGTYGVVLKCREKETQTIVAIKKIKILRKEDSFPINTIREVDLLSSLNHINIIDLKCVLFCYIERTVYLVLEYCPYDLYALFNMPKIKRPRKQFMFSIMLQLTDVLRYLRIKNIAHRDLKPANIFVTSNNILKLGDFGLARILNEDGQYTDNVVSLWYRPLELIFGSREYSCEIDIWSAGCIFFEMVAGKPLFMAQKNDDLSQYKTITDLCGTPEESDWPSFGILPRTQKFLESETSEKKKNKLHEYLKKNLPKYDFTDLLIDLLIRMLQLNPKNRITPDRMLEHDFFKMKNFPYDPCQLKSIETKEIHLLKVQELKISKKKC